MYFPSDPGAVVKPRVRLLSRFLDKARHVLAGFFISSRFVDIPPSTRQDFPDI